MMFEKELADRERDARRIGPFAFDNDEDIDCEVLTSDQVYADLMELDDIMGKTSGTDAKKSQEFSRGSLRKGKK